MKKVTSLFLAVLVLMTLTCKLWAQTSPSLPDYQEKLKVSQQIVALTWQLETMTRIAESMLAPARADYAIRIKRNNPQLEASQLKRAVDLYDKALDKISNQYVTEVLAVIFENLAKSYAKNFSLAELNAINQYQASDVGRKAQQFTLNEIPELMKPALPAMQRMANDAAEVFVEIGLQLAQEGIVFK